MSAVSTKALIIAGMRRSGTSWVAQAFHAAGLFLGDHLIPPLPSNPLGFCEDEQVIRLHTEMLRANGPAARWVFRILRNRRLTVSPEHEAEARRIIHQEYSRHSMWGWKDPRATLFLDLWQRLLPGAKFVLPFRQPAEVVWSLMRAWRMRNPAGFLHAWILYNQMIVNFARQHADACLLIHVPYDLRPEAQGLLVDVIVHRWSFDLPNLDFSRTYRPSLMAHPAPQWIRAIARGYPPASGTYKDLVRLHDELLHRHRQGTDWSYQKAPSGN